MTGKLTLVALALLSATHAAFALGSDSTMADWNTASAADREALVDALGPGLSAAFKTERAAILACMERTGDNPAHESLPVAEVVKACIAVVESPQTPNPADEI